LKEIGESLLAKNAVEFSDDLYQLNIFYDRFKSDLREYFSSEFRNKTKELKLKKKMLQIMIELIKLETVNNMNRSSLSLDASSSSKQRKRSQQDPIFPTDMLNVK
jgi:hypothetical protein